MWKSLRSPDRLTCALSLCLTLAAVPAAAQTPDTVIVLDFGASMWGKIGVTPKFQTARDAIVQALAARPALRAGIVAFGHTQAKACNDAAILATPGNTAAAMESALATLRPKGQAGLADAIAKARGPGAPPGRVLVITDGIDNCRGDPCAAALALAQGGVTEVHGIVFDSAAATLAPQLACIAQGRGRFAAVTTAGELTSALAAALPPVASVRSVVATPVPVGAIADPNLPGTVTLSALLAAGGTPVAQGVVWRIYRPAGERFRLAAQSRDAQPRLTLPPGDYLIHAAFGKASVTRRLRIAAGQDAAEDTVLNAGALRVSVSVGGKPPPRTGDITVDLFSDDADQAGNRAKIMGGVKPGVPLRLNSGIYHLSSTYGDGNALAEADVTVEPGKLTEVAIDHRAGRVTLRLVSRTGGEAIADTSWTILDAAGEVVKRSAGAFPTHVLAAGKYQLRAENGGRSFSQEFEVAPGDVKQIELLSQ